MTKKAITLIELLIASSIFVVIMMSIYLTFNTGLFGYKDIEENIDIYQSARLVLERLNLDLRNYFGYSSEETKFTGSNNEVSFLTLTDKLSQGKLIKSYTFVSYRLDGKNLMRLCRRGEEALNEKSETKAQELAANIESLTFSYGFIEAGDNEVKWIDNWDDKKIFPIAVKAKIIVLGKQKQAFERTIYLP